MSKTSWTIVVIIIVVIILYVVYRYMFNKQNQLTTNVGGVIIPIAPIVNPHIIHPTPTAIVDNGYSSDENVRLMKMINCLGYQIQPIKDDGAVSAYVTNKTLELFEKRFPKTEVIANISGVITSNVITITTNGITYKLDKDKFIEMQNLGLYNNITYINKNKDQIKSITDKLNSFWGIDYFYGCLGFPSQVGQETNRIVTKIQESSKTKVDCNSKEYANKLLRLATDYKQAGNKYQLAVYNLNNVDNAENTQALTIASKNLSITEKLYKEYNALCNLNK